VAQRKTAHKTPWTKDDVRELKAHSKARTPLPVIAKKDEANRAGASAKGGNSRYRPGTSPLTRHHRRSVVPPATNSTTTSRGRANDPQRGRLRSPFLRRIILIQPTRCKSFGPALIGVVGSHEACRSPLAVCVPFKVGPGRGRLSGRPFCVARSNKEPLRVFD
jgi:hypothetical protein